MAQVTVISFEAFEESIAIIVTTGGRIFERAGGNKETANYNIYIKKNDFFDYDLNDEAQFILKCCKNQVDSILWETRHVEYCSYDRIHFCFYEFVKEIKNGKRSTIVGNKLFDCTCLI